MGRVLLEETQQPLAGVRVFLYPIPFPEGGRLDGAFVGALREVGFGELERTVPSPALARSDASGAYVIRSLQQGRYVIVANPGYAPGRRAAAAVADSRTFFPGTLDFAEAQLVSVARAQVVTGLDFTMLAAPTFEVSGIVVDTDGQPWRVSRWPSTPTGASSVAARAAPGRLRMAASRSPASSPGGIV